MELNNLGKQTPHVLIGADPVLLEVVPVTWDDGFGLPMEISLVGEEFTSLCPATGGPDFGTIFVKYIPNKTIVESKAFKYYMESYRNERIFHEAVVAKISFDLVALLDPFFLKVQGKFKPRGGWAILPEKIYFRDGFRNPNGNFGRNR